MKLYTEVEVRTVLNAVSKLYKPLSVDEIVDFIIPIELPSDEEIQDAANEYAGNKKRIKNLSNREFDLSKNDFIKATKWFKEQITKTK